MSVNRGTIFLADDAKILAQSRHPGDQYILRVEAPAAAQSANPGSFAHITCDDSIPMRRPLSIMAVDREAGWLEFLYRSVGQGTAALARKQAGDRVSLLGPIGKPFALDPARPRLVAIGGGVGIPPMIFLAQKLHRDSRFVPLVLMGSEVPFPFELAAPSRHDRWAGPTTASLGLLEEWGVPSRLASNAGLAGAYAGFVTDLARSELAALGADELAETQLAACGPEPMLEAAARLAADFDLPCQIAVEEYMACGVGGCAGCTILVHSAQGTAMKRVCVDGPVFEAREIYPAFAAR